eukprot:m51a1_g9476 hypothetical protein (319) ;mRNA; r:592690-593646
MIADIGAMLEGQWQERVAADKEYEMRIASLETALSDANQRLKVAEKESELNKKLHQDARNDLERAIAQNAALSDRAASDGIQIREMAIALESLTAQMSKQTEHLNEVETHRTRDAAKFEARIKDLAAEIVEARCKRAEAEADLKRHVELAVSLQAELNCATARITALCNRISDDDQHIADMASELAQTKGTLSVSEHARSAAVAERDTTMARVEQGERLARRICMKLSQVERVLKAEEKRSAEFAAKAQQSEALAMRLQAQLDVAPRHISNRALLAELAEQDENAVASNSLFIQPVRKSPVIAPAVKDEWQTYTQCTK